MAHLTKASILGAIDLPIRSVEVPEWGGTVGVRTMTGTERDAFESTLQVIGEGDKKRADMRNIRARVCALCIVGENGERLFTDAEVDSLGKKSAAALDRVFNVAQEMNGMGEKAVEAAKKP